MYTIPNKYQSHKINLFYDIKIPEGVSGNYDSVKENETIGNDTQKLIADFAKRVIDTFEKNPEQKNQFLNELNGVKEKVFKDARLFRLFLNKAYENHSTALENLTGLEKSEKIKDFSKFITDVMLQFTEMNNIPRLSMAIQAQQKALERGVQDTNISQALDKLSGKIKQ
ncbi:hypothetical protein KBD33_03725 [Candidatus Gracilibacteria bacterium]|nr:hypothetical protein [Candidatus Gracilibacteria bacterium]